MNISFNPNLNKIFQTHYQNLLKSSYNKMFRGNISFCDLYLLNEDSVFNEKIDSYYENVGGNSPLRFTLIQNYPLFNVQSQSLPLNWSIETGIKSDEVSLEFNIAPFNIQPFTGCFIKMDTDDFKGLFKVNNFEEATLDSDMAKKQTATLSRHSSLEIEGQVTDRLIYRMSNDTTIPLDTYDIKVDLEVDFKNKISLYFDTFFNMADRTLGNSDIHTSMSSIIKNLKYVSDGTEIEFYDDELYEDLLTIMTDEVNDRDISEELRLKYNLTEIINSDTLSVSSEFIMLYPESKKFVPKVIDNINLNIMSLFLFLLIQTSTFNIEEDVFSSSIFLNGMYSFLTSTFSIEISFDSYLKKLLYNSYI